jgi:hypothetical protein
VTGWQASNSAIRGCRCPLTDNCIAPSSVPCPIDWQAEQVVLNSGDCFLLEFPDANAVVTAEKSLRINGCKEGGSLNSSWQGRGFHRHAKHRGSPVCVGGKSLLRCSPGLRGTKGALFESHFLVSTQWVRISSMIPLEITRPIARAVVRKHVRRCARAGAGRARPRPSPCRRWPGICR